MKIVLQRAADGMGGYISTYAVHSEYRNILEPIVCKEVGTDEYDDFLYDMENDDRYLIERPETANGSMPQIHISEKNIPHYPVEPKL